MGVGKTSVGRELARALGWPHHDSDASLQSREGATARELAQETGVDRLHHLEAQALLDALARSGPSVISAAASTIGDGRCREALAAPDVFVVWLRADPSVLVARARRGRHRPELADDLDALLGRQAEERGPLFSAIADLTVDASSASPASLAKEITEALPER